MVLVLLALTLRPASCNGTITDPTDPSQGLV